MQVTYPQELGSENSRDIYQVLPSNYGYQLQEVGVFKGSSTELWLEIAVTYEHWTVAPVIECIIPVK